MKFSSEIFCPNPDFPAETGCLYAAVAADLDAPPLMYWGWLADPAPLALHSVALMTLLGRDCLSFLLADSASESAVAGCVLQAGSSSRVS